MRNTISRAARHNYEVQMVNLRLRQTMLEQGMTHSDLARRAGVSRAALARYTAGGCSMSVEVLMKLAAALNCSPEWLVTGRKHDQVELRVPAARQYKARPASTKHVPIAKLLLGKLWKFFALLKFLFIARDCH